MHRYTRLSALISVFLVPSSGTLAQEVVDLPDGDRIIDLDFVEVYRVSGALLGSPALLSAQARIQLAFDAQGELHVLNHEAGAPRERGGGPGTTRVIVLATDGSLAREFGRMGFERGDFRGPGDLVVMGDGRTIVQDGEHSAFMIFGPDGQYERMVRYPRPGTGMASVVMGFGGIPGMFDVTMGSRGEDFSLFRTRQADVSIDMDMATMGFIMRRTGPTGVVERVGLERNRVTVDTIVQARRPVEGTEMVIGMQLNGDLTQLTANQGANMDLSSLVSTNETQLPKLFAPPFVFGAMPEDGLAYIDSSAYEITLVDAGGEIRKILRRPLTPTPVSEDLRREFLAKIQEAQKVAAQDMTESLKEAGGPVTGMELPGMLDFINRISEQVLDQLEFFPEIPVLSNLQVSWEGSLWAYRTGDPLAGFDGDDNSVPTPLADLGLADGPGPIDLISAEGEYVGTFAAGTAAPVAFGPKGLAAWIEYDDSSQPEIVVRRIAEALRRP